MGPKPRPRYPRPFFEDERDFFDKDEIVVGPEDDLRMAGSCHIGIDPKQRREGIFVDRPQGPQSFQQSIPRPDAVRRHQAAATRRRARQGPFTRRRLELLSKIPEAIGSQKVG